MAEDLLMTLKSYGIFVVPVGEVKSWLPNLNVKGKSVEWLIAIFSKMGQNKEDQEYLNPADNDVWKFIDNISEWTSAQTKSKV
jgi:hypothetical protein